MTLTLADPPTAWWNPVHHCIAALRARRGHLVAFGGGQDPAGLVRPAFVHLAGGSAARIAIVPVASRVPQTREVYRSLFYGMGAADVWIVDPEGEQSNDPVIENALRHASGIVITGGDQKLLVRELENTLAARSLLAALEHGSTIFTTSAGTMALSDMMVAGLEDDDTLRIRPGLGFLPGITIETHVDTRRRHARLDELITRRVNPLIMGIDENTAAVFEPNSSRALVLGVGQVVVMGEEGPASDCPSYRAGQFFDLADLVP